MRSRCMSLLPRTTLHSDSEQLKWNNRNKRLVSDSAKTSFGSSFGCFDTKLVSEDTLAKRKEEGSPHMRNERKEEGTLRIQIVYKEEGM